MDSKVSVVAGDRFARHVGIDLVQIAPGQATARMQVLPHHYNGMGVVQGGAVFTLADLAFAAAANSHGIPAVALSVTINYLRPGRSGVLTAQAKEVSVTSKVGTYLVEVTDEAGQCLALFQGLAYRKQPPASLSDTGGAAGCTGTPAAE